MTKIKYNIQQALITYTLFFAYPIAQITRALDLITYSDAFVWDLRLGFWIALIALLGEEHFRIAINLVNRAKGIKQQNEDEK